MKKIRMHARHVVFLVAIFVAMAGLSACGGGGGGGGTTTGSSLSGSGA